MTVGRRYNNFDINRPPLEFGVQWDPSISDPVNCLTRLGDAENLKVNTMSAGTYALHESDFDAYWPWGGVRRVSLNRNGDYISVHGETDALGASTFNEGAVDKKIMVEIPKFWYLILKDTPSAGIWQLWISPFPMPGYSLHPMFLRAGAPIDSIYVGAYEGFVDASAYPNLFSYAGVAPATNYTRAQFRAYANNVGINCTHSGPVNVEDFGLMDWQTWNGIQLLYLIEYASLDSMTPSGSTQQGGIGPGITSSSGVEKTGWTSSTDVNEHGLHSVDLGNSSGTVKCNTSAFAMSYRGIENCWGNTFTLLDAINISTDRSIWLNILGSGLADQAVGAMGLPYIQTTYLAAAASGNPQCLTGWGTYDDDNWMFEKFLMGGSTSTYMCSAYTVANWTEPRFPRVGGAYDSGAGSGIFCEDVTLGYASANTRTGARLQYIRPPTGYYKY